MLKLIIHETKPSFRSYPSELQLHAASEFHLLRLVTPLRAVPEVILNFQGLRCLDITGHPVTALPAEIGQMRSLKRIVMISCHLQELPDEICDLPLLEQMLLCSNQLRGIPTKVASMPNLWRLTLDANRISALPEILPRYTDSIKISTNKLTHLPERLGDYPKISDIQAYGNLLTRLPESLTALPNLRHLMLHGNRLASLPDGIGNLQSLESLLLHDNLLERLPDSLSDLPQLQWLYVYNNKLQELPACLGECSRRWSRLLVEANPLSAAAVGRLFASEAVGRLRVFGADEEQVSRWQASGMCANRQPPRNCAVGRMLPWGCLYAKLMPASRLSGSKGVPAAPSNGQAAKASEMLVVAFSASQGEPEWMGMLGQIVQPGARTVEDAQQRIVREPRQSFDELYSAVHGTSLEEDASSSSKAMSALWYEYSNSELLASGDACPQDGSRLQDFDVLCMCDSNAQWYYDTDSHKLDVESKLRDLVAGYRSVLFLGVSMGGFAALSYAHLADTVAVFGPQTDLTRSHLRPGFKPECLVAASRHLQDNVHRALCRGTRIEYHVAMEDHLLYARFLPLPRGSLIVHPTSGRIARVLERNGILVPLLIDLFAELQSSSKVRPIAASQALAMQFSAEAFADARAWDWGDAGERSVTLAKWNVKGGISLVEARPSELAVLMQETPCVGAWFCNACCHRNEEDKRCCDGCGADSRPQHKVGLVQPKAAPKVHQCMACGKRHETYSARCVSCTGELEFTCVFCGKFGREADGRGEDVKLEWYCHPCWEKFDQHNRSMAAELPECWFVTGGQVWAWEADGGARQSGQIEFDRAGKLLTTWGVGSWTCKGEALEVTLGKPPEAYRLARSPSGFIATHLAPTTSGSAGGSSSVVAAPSARGRPVYGLPRQSGGVGGLFGRAIAFLVLLMRRNSQRTVFLAGLAPVVLAVVRALVRAFARRRALRA